MNVDVTRTEDDVQPYTIFSSNKFSSQALPMSRIS